MSLQLANMGGIKLLNFLCRINNPNTYFFNQELTMTKKHLPNCIQHFLLVAGLLISLVIVPVKAENESPVLITYTYEHELLPKLENEPLLTIYSNGSIRGVFPSFMKRKGVHQAQLKPGALRKLKALILAGTKQRLSTETISAEIAHHQALQEQIGETDETLFAVLDSTTTIIEYQVPQNALNTSESISGGGNNSSKRIVQKDLAVMARQYPGVTTLQATNKLKRLLQKILDTSDWTSVGGDS